MVARHVAFATDFLISPRDHAPKPSSRAGPQGQALQQLVAHHTAEPIRYLYMVCLQRLFPPRLNEEGAKGQIVGGESATSLWAQTTLALGSAHPYRLQRWVARAAGDGELALGDRWISCSGD